MHLAASQHCAGRDAAVASCAHQCPSAHQLQLGTNIRARQLSRTRLHAAAFQQSHIQSTYQTASATAAAVSAPSGIDIHHDRAYTDIHFPEGTITTQGSGAATRKPALQLSWAGSGIYFWWQLGCVKYLLERYSLANVPMVGASGGALAAVLAACNVDAGRIFELAYAMSHEYQIWERRLGLVGVWGSLIERWLDELLPEDAADRCRGRVTIVVTALPFMEQLGINDFTDKKDLINVCMASAHVPVLLDWRATRACRSRQCVDGSFPDFFSGANCDLLTCAGNSVMFDYFDDPNLVRNGRLDMLELKAHTELRRIMDLGYQFADKLHEEGVFDRFDVTNARLAAKHGAQHGQHAATEAQFVPAGASMGVAAAAAGAQ